MNREDIYSALFSKLSSVQGFVTTSRRLKHWSDVPPADQPALFVAQKSEEAHTVPGLNTVWQLKVEVYVYTNTGGVQTDTPSTTINPLLDAIVTALAPDPITNKQTLGGLVQHCWIEGAIETDEGVLGDQAIAIIPVVLKAV